MTVSRKFMSQFHGQPCAICGTTLDTGGHHIMKRRVCPQLVEHTRNIMVLCGKHHNYDKDISAHGSHKAQREYDSFCQGKLGLNYKDDLRALDRSLRGLF
jgi:hypothetical protein